MKEEGPNKQTHKKKQEDKQIMTRSKTTNHDKKQGNNAIIH